MQHRFLFESQRSKIKFQSCWFRFRIKLNRVRIRNWNFAVEGVFCTRWNWSVLLSCWWSVIIKEKETRRKPANISSFKNKSVPNLTEEETRKNFEKLRFFFCETNRKKNSLVNVFANIVIVCSSLCFNSIWKYIRWK